MGTNSARGGIIAAPAMASPVALALETLLTAIEVMACARRGAQAGIHEHPPSVEVCCLVGGRVRLLLGRGRASLF
jgi:hypothetical protein